MRSSVVIIFLVTVTINYIAAEPTPVANPEPWLGNQAEKYCKNYVGEFTAEQVCRNASNYVVKKLKSECESGVNKVCGVTFGFADTCKAWVNSVLCPEVYEVSTDVETPKDTKRPWLQEKIESTCEKEVNPYIAKKDGVCQKVKEVVSTNCKSIIVELCDKYLASGKKDEKLLKKIAVQEEEIKNQKKSHSKHHSKGHSKHHSNKPSKNHRKQKHHGKASKKSEAVADKGFLPDLSSACKWKWTTSIIEQLCE